MLRVSVSCKTLLCYNLRKTQPQLVVIPCRDVTLTAASIAFWNCSQHHDGSLMLAERRGMLNESVQTMNEAETRLIRSPLLCSALWPRKHQNDLLFLRHSQKPLNVSFFFFRHWSFFPNFHISQRGHRSAWNACVKLSHRRTRSHFVPAMSGRGGDIRVWVSTSTVTTCQTRRKEKENERLSPGLKQASRFYSRLRNVDTEQRATSSLTTFKTPTQFSTSPLMSSHKPVSYKIALYSVLLIRLVKPIVEENQPVKKFSADDWDTWVHMLCHVCWQVNKHSWRLDRDLCY